MFLDRRDKNADGRLALLTAGRATGLPTELQRYDCNMQREQTLAGDE